MIWNMIHLILVLNTALASPENILLPEVTDFSPPEEVNALQNSQKVQKSISDHVVGENTEETIKEVEDLIKSNPELPRLTRGEILDILDNITKQDQRNLIGTISKDTNRDPKALMVVKAYTPLGSGEVNVEDFYTKPPITSIVDNEEEELPVQDVGSTAASVPHFRRKTTKTSENKKITDVERKKPYRGNSQYKTTSTLSSSPRTRSTTTERFTTTTNLPSTTRKEIKRRRRPPVTTTTMISVTTYRPRGRLPPRKEIKYSNHQYPEEAPNARPYPYFSNGLRVVEAPKIVPTQINYDLEDLLPQEGEHQETFMPMPTDQTKKGYPSDKENSISEPSIELEIPEHLKKVVADLNLAAIKDPQSVSITSIVPPSEKAESEKIKDILASLGVLPPTASTTTSTDVPDAHVVADSLSPDMQELLKSFGLLPDASNDNQAKNEVASFNPEKAEIHPESYVGFKPLPDDSQGRKEMEDLLEQFGLLDKNNRKTKSLKKGKAVSENDPHKDIQIEQIDLDAVPEHLQPLLKEMGFGQARLGRKIREQPVDKVVVKATENVEMPIKALEKQHVFNPADSEHVSEEEIRKLGRLLEIMKKLEALNGTITEEDLKQIDQQELKDLISSIKQPQGENFLTLDEQAAPNPVEYDFGLRKNEVKRQEGTTAEPVDTVTAETITEDTKTPSIKDLEDSFGGSTETVTEALPETTTAKRSGFYYLLDWNTFFEIDDQKGKRVNLRFQPKVGDPKRFFSVNVP